MDGIDKIVKYVFAGIFACAALVIIAKDGQQLGSFMTSTATALSTFSKGLTAGS